MTEEEVYSLIHLNVPSLLISTDEIWLKPIMQSFIEKEKARSVKEKQEDTSVDTDLRLFQFLMHQIEVIMNQIVHFRKNHSDFNNLYSQAVTAYDRQLLILNYAKELGRSRKELKKDARAFSRWFDVDAIKERYHTRIWRLEFLTVLIIKRLPPLIKHILNADPEINGQQFWHRFNLGHLLMSLLKYQGDERIVISALQCIHALIDDLKIEYQAILDTPGMTFFLFRSALKPDFSVWIQSEALAILHVLKVNSIMRLLHKKLTQTDAEDDMFVRKRAVSLLIPIMQTEKADFSDLLQTITSDPSAYVRQTLAERLSDLPTSQFRVCQRQLACMDNHAAVRAAAILSFYSERHTPDLFEEILNTIQCILKDESSAFVLRISCKVIFDCYLVLLQQSKAKANIWTHTLTPLLEKLHINAESLVVRRAAAEVIERMWVKTNPKAQAVQEILAPIIHNLTSGSRKRIAGHLLKQHDEELIGRVMSVMTQKSFGLAIKKARKQTVIYRGPIFAFQFWRLFYELRHPSPDKRQAYPYTKARISKGHLCAPSNILAEVTKTPVPGEPLHLESENGYRPYLPLMADVMSCLRTPHQPMLIFTSEGITSLMAPQNRLKRAKAYIRLQTNFAYFADLRNWHEDSSDDPKRYLLALHKLGFSIQFRPYEERESDPAVRRFFPAIGFLPFSEHWLQFQDYFFSAYGNTLSSLFIFTLTALFIFIGLHQYNAWKVKRARKRFSLVLGGEGTRGKSGVERLKASMLNALGYHLISKTTGSEATVLHGQVFGNMQELLLFRPFEKASIWEQTKVMELAKNLDADIFLWECMGLRPEYIRILQRQWSKDNVSTLTNAYPDHEDMQGPSGIDVAKSLCDFIYPSGQLISSEQQMQPVIHEAAQQLGCEFTGVHWWESGLLTEDILSRFPYKEHPENIALVLKLAEKAGLEKDFVLKEMADRIIPEIGMLKVFPPAPIQTRSLVFVNSMSANEYYGCLNNWKRLNLDKHSPYKEPGECLVTIVNNRADRVARSREFASLLVHDLNADRHILIGSNISGLLGYIDVELNHYSKQHITLWPQGGNTQVRKQAEIYAKNLRIPYLKEHVKDRLRKMLKIIEEKKHAARLLEHWNDADQLTSQLEKIPLNKDLKSEILFYHNRNRHFFETFCSIVNEAESAEKHQYERMDKRFRTLFKSWFKQKLHVIDDYYASGDEIVHQIQKNTPPGNKAFVVGIQNIKGPGMSVVKAWQKWDICYKACQKLRQDKPEQQEEGIRNLADFYRFNLLCEEYVNQSLETVKGSSTAQQEWFQTAITQIESNLKQDMKRIESELSRENGKHWTKKLAHSIKLLFDTTWGIRRRKIADRIYQDLVDERISSERAEKELHRLNKNQSVY